MKRTSAQTRLSVIAVGVATALSVIAPQPLHAQTASAQDDATLVLPQVYVSAQVVSKPSLADNVGSGQKPCDGDPILCTPDPLDENGSRKFAQGALTSSGKPNVSADVATLQDYQQGLTVAGVESLKTAPAFGSSAVIASLSRPPPLATFSTASNSINPLNVPAAFSSGGAFPNTLDTQQTNSLAITPGNTTGLSPFAGCSDIMFMLGP